MAEAPGFGALLRRLRLRVGLTQEALAERAGISARAVGDLERYPERLPRLDSANMLAQALGLDPVEQARFLAAARPEPPAPSAPELATAFTRPLPRPLTTLIGRESAVGEVVALLRGGEHRLVTLTGPGGVGKTRLAIAIAGQVASVFAENAIFVDLAPLRDPKLVLPLIAQRLGLDHRAGTPIDEQLAAHLRGKQLLLLLDNCEHLVEIRGDILTLLEACPTLAVLATSRVALRVRGEREYRVAPLALPLESAPARELAQSAAVALFLARARDVGTELSLDETTGPAISAICHRLDGLPLAIELAAAWARLLPPVTLLDRLHQRLPLLVGGAHDLPARQRTMRDAIAWSYDLLDPAQQRLFRRLCVFVGSCTTEAAEAICADTGRDPVSPTELAALVDRSLLRSHLGGQETAGSRLTMLETIREYGLERLAESGEGELLRRRHAAYYLALAERAEPEFGWPQGVVWQERLARDHDNLRAALRWAIDGGDVELGLRLAAALWRFWSERGHLREGGDWLREALSAAVGTTAVDDAIRVKALIGSARLAIEHAAYDEAEAFCAQAIALARARAMSRELATALNAHGLLDREWGRYTDAVRHYEEARAIAITHGDAISLATALAGLAYAATFGGDVSRGNALAEESLALLRDVGSTRELAEALVGLATQIVHIGDNARAGELADEALAHFRTLGDTGRAAEALWVLGVAAQLQERDERAGECYEECLAMRRERGDEHGAIQPLAALGALAMKRDEHARARAMLEESLEMAARYDDRWSRAMSLIFLGHVAVALGELVGATAHLTEAIALCEALGNPLYLPWCLEGLAAVAAAQHRWESAAHLCGASDARQGRSGLALPAVHPARHNATRALISAALGEARFAEARKEGETLTLEQALAAVGASGGSAR